MHWYRNFGRVPWYSRAANLVCKSRETNLAPTNLGFCHHRDCRLSDKWIYCVSTMCDAFSLGAPGNRIDGTSRSNAIQCTLELCIV